MTDNLLTAEELMASLGLPSTTSPTSPASSTPSSGRAYKKSFKTRQFPLLSTPYFIIYLQGICPLTLRSALVSPPNESVIISNAFKEATFRALSPRSTSLSPQQIAAITAEARAFKPLFYTDKAAHSALLKGWVNQGATLTKEKVASRSNLLTTLLDYTESAMAFSLMEGFPSLSDYLDYLSTTAPASTSTLTAEDLDAAFDDL